MVASVVSTVSSTAAKHELVGGFTGETITMKEIIDNSGLSKVTLLKLLSVNGVQPVGKVVSGSRGRPAALFDRDTVTRLLADRASAKSGKAKKASTVKVEADASAEPEDSVAEMSVDEINAALAD